MTMLEYSWQMQALKLRKVDEDYRSHLNAFLNFAVQAKKRQGKDKVKPVYGRFSKFFDYEKALEEARKEPGEKKSRFVAVSRYLKGEKNNGREL